MMIDEERLPARRVELDLTFVRPGGKVLLVGVVGLLLFAALTFAVNERMLVDIDLNATIALQPFVQPYLEQGSIAITFLLSAEVCILYAVIFSLILWRSGAGIWSVLPLGFGVPVLLELALKHWVHQPLVPQLYYHDVPLPLVDVTTPSSFPSGHSLRAAWFAVFLGRLWRPGSAWRRWAGRALLLGAALLVGLSRVYLGVHWTTDVVGGFILGGALALPAAEIVVLLDRWRSRCQSEWNVR